MYDVIVVGAGHAGSYAAYKSASSGLKTLLIEKERLPRWKACGGPCQRVDRGGIPPAIYSAEKAAETCLEMIKNDDFSEKASRRYPSRCRSAFRNLRFRTKLVEILDSDTPSDFELPGIAESLVRRLSAVASQSL